VAAPQNRPSTTLEIPINLHPVYANLVRIAHSSTDMVFDFAHLFPGEPRALVSARIVMSPLSAKFLLKALTDNVAAYESAFGEIVLPASNLADQLFKPPQQPPGTHPPSNEEKS
jgi:hypothetical protein